MANTTATKHPFGELLAQYRARRPGLTQTRLAELTGYDQAIVTRMAQGKKDLTGPSGRERILRLIEILADQNCLTTLDEANALLLATDLPPLFERQPAEAKLIARFGKTPAGLSPILSPRSDAFGTRIGGRTRRTNLPALVSSFIGRAAEVAEVRQRLTQSRLVTLTGSGGTGKTRLAQRVAADVLLHYLDGVWYVELAALSDGGLIADAAMRAMGLVPSDQPALERVVEHLSERHALLVLDNCEHLIDAVAAFAIAVLHACPRVTILATSREALNVEGERAWRVPPMQPDEAGALFVERAIAQKPISAGDETVTQICRRLDGMPLAIELAASRLQVMSLSDIAARLDDRFTLLAHGRRGALPRHQTLRAMIDWSYELLSEAEQTAFRRLGVFLGGWEIDLATSLPGKDALALLTQLVNKSLVVVDEADGVTRYHLLETIREYALEKLREAGELAALQEKHARIMMQWAEAMERQMRVVWHDAMSRRIERNFPNVNAALVWSFSLNGDPAVGSHIIGTLHVFWFANTHSQEQSRWVALALKALRDDMPAKARAGLLMLAAMTNGGIQGLDNILAALCEAQHGYEEAGDLAGAAYAMSHWGNIMVDRDASNPEGPAALNAALTLARAHDAPLVARRTILAQIYYANMTSQDAEAERLMVALIDECKRAGDKGNLCRALFHYAEYVMEALQFDRATQLFTEAEAMAWDAPQLQIVTLIKSRMAEIARYQGNPAHAIELCEAHLEFIKAYLGSADRFWPIFTLAKALVDIGEKDRARLLACGLVQESLGLYNPEPTMLYHPLDAAAYVEACAGDPVKAARLFGISDHCVALSHLRRWRFHDWEYAPRMRALRETLGDAAFNAAYAAGYATPLAQVAAYTLDMA